MRGTQRLKKTDKKIFRIVAFSDTHGSFSAMNTIFRKTTDADVYIFLGDGEQELERICSLYPDRRVISVCGNCDYNSNAPKEILFSAADGRKIFCTHGNRYSVNSSPDRIYYRTLELGADVVLFGHTHCRYYSYTDGIYIINPGSAACPRDGLDPSYAIVDLASGGVVCSHVKLR